MSLADHKGFLRVCGEVIRLLLKYCIYCASVPSLHHRRRKQT